MIQSAKLICFRRKRLLTQKLRNYFHHVSKVANTKFGSCPATYFSILTHYDHLQKHKWNVELAVTS